MCDVSNKQVYYFSTIYFNNTPDEERVLGCSLTKINELNSNLCSRT
jgi:hypothetical protein